MPNTLFTKNLPQQTLSERGHNSPAVVNTTDKDRILRKIHEAVARKQQKKRMEDVVDLHPKLKGQKDGDPNTSQSQIQQGAVTEAALSEVSQGTLRSYIDKNNTTSRDFDTSLDRKVSNRFFGKQLAKNKIGKIKNPDANARVAARESFDRQTVDKILSREIKLTEDCQASIAKKSQHCGIPTYVLETVYRRGIIDWEEGMTRTQSQYAFDRVNSFIAKGKARELDQDLLEQAPVKDRFVGTPELTDTYKKDTPGQERIKTIRNQLRSINTRTQGPK